MYGCFPLENRALATCMNIFDADMYVYIRCFCYVLYVMIWIAMYGLSCISPWPIHIPGERSKVFLYVDLYRRKNILIDTTEIDYLNFIYMPHNEFRAGRDGFHAPSETFICPVHACHAINAYARTLVNGYLGEWWMSTSRISHSRSGCIDFSNHWLNSLHPYNLAAKW